MRFSKVETKRKPRTTVEFETYGELVELGDIIALDIPDLRLSRRKFEREKAARHREPYPYLHFRPLEIDIPTTALYGLHRHLGAVDETLSTRLMEAGEQFGPYSQTSVVVSSQLRRIHEIQDALNSHHEGLQAA